MIPSAGSRIAVAVLKSILLALALIVVPIFLLNRFGPAGLTTPITSGTFLLYGVVVSVLYGVRSALRPTRAFGPLSIAASGLGIAYLLYLASSASFGIVRPEMQIAFDFGDLFRLLAIVPLFGLLAGIVTTIEDFARPGERVRFEYAAAA